jgi:Fe-S-cluster containining protein
MVKEPWYKEGLRFKCTGCGECCTGSPGYVWVDEEEIALLSSELQISKEAFIKQYTRRIGDRISLKEHPPNKEHPQNHDCVFLKERKCLVYSARPKQCRTYPWWPENLSSRKAWEAEAKRCEGINHPDAILYKIDDTTS